MKKSLLIIGLATFISSCTTSFYQLYKVEPVFESTGKNGELIYEDENCKVSYEIWAEGGNIGFNFYNKTADNLSINLKKSFFILNDFAYDYFKNRTFISSKTSGVVAANRPLVNVSQNYGTSVSIKEDSIVVVPGGTSKRVSEFSINTELIRSCDLLRYPMIKDIETNKYNNASSPLVFSNRIYYSINGNGKEIQNEFYVSEITNYPSSKFFEYRSEENCGQKGTSKPKQFKYSDPNNFYIKYLKTGSSWKH